jgi:hypothetical protein
VNVSESSDPKVVLRLAILREKKAGALSSLGGVETV